MIEKIIDPADKIKEKRKEDRSLKDMKKLDINNLKLSDFHKIPKKRARFIHPFEGYALAEEIELSEDLSVSKTFIIALNPHNEPDQDPSGLNMTIKNLKTEINEKKTIKTSHSRLIRTGPSKNEDVVFDRIMKVDGRPISYAIVPQHSVRAQICFYYNSKNERYEVDGRYMMLDIKQDSRLMRLFQLINKPNLKREQMAAEVAGESESTEDSLKSLPTEV